MVKSIVVCCDGTWDGAQGEPASNVLKLFDALDGNLTLGGRGDPEQERRAYDGETVVQVAKYIHGVGDSKNPLDRILGGSFGMGLLSRVLRGYTYISRVYETGDKIFLVGFSRGAYTARALAGLIAGMGLLEWGALNLTKGKPDEAGYKHAAAAWYEYQKKQLNAAIKHPGLHMIETFFTDLGALLPALEIHHPKYYPDVKVEAVGVWDTVGSLGIPLLSPDHGVRLDALRLADTTLAANINHAFHAVAADEERVDFTPTLWDADPRVVQRFFAGSHADVGGGYPEGEHSGLSNLALAWMANQLKGLGVRFANDPPIKDAGTPLAPLHMAWTASPYDMRPSEPREFPPFEDGTHAITVDDSLRERMKHHVAAVTATDTPVSHTGPYLPMSLVNAGYLDVNVNVK
jgi:glutathione S-transferase